MSIFSKNQRKIIFMQMLLVHARKIKNIPLKKIQQKTINKRIYNCSPICAFINHLFKQNKIKINLYSLTDLQCLKNKSIWVLILICMVIGFYILTKTSLKKDAKLILIRGMKKIATTTKFSGYIKSPLFRETATNYIATIYTNTENFTNTKKTCETLIKSCFHKNNDLVIAKALHNTLYPNLTFPQKLMYDIMQENNLIKTPVEFENQISGLNFCFEIQALSWIPLQNIAKIQYFNNTDIPSLSLMEKSLLFSGQQHCDAKITVKNENQFNEVFIDVKHKAEYLIDKARLYSFSKKNDQILISNSFLNLEDFLMIKAKKLQQFQKKLIFFSEEIQFDFKNLATKNWEDFKQLQELELAISFKFIKHMQNYRPFFINPIVNLRDLPPTTDENINPIVKEILSKKMSWKNSNSNIQLIDDLLDLIAW